MADKLTIQDLSAALAEKNGIDRKDAETFIRAMFDLIEESLEKDKYVKVKGFGVFKLISVNNRESVNINTGERFEIQEHYKVSFIPDPTLKGIINKPFEFFDSVVLNEGIELENTEEDADIKTSEANDREDADEPLTVDEDMAVETQEIDEPQEVEVPQGTESQVHDSHETDETQEIETPLYDSQETELKEAEPQEIESQPTEADELAQSSDESTEESEQTNETSAEEAEQPYEPADEVVPSDEPVEEEVGQPNELYAEETASSDHSIEETEPSAKGAETSDEPAEEEAEQSDGLYVEETEPSSENLESAQTDEVTETEPVKKEDVADADAYVGEVVEFSSSENFYTDEAIDNSAGNTDSSEASTMTEETVEKVDDVAEQPEEVADEKADGVAESTGEVAESIVEVTDPTAEKNAGPADEATDLIGEETESDQEPSEESSEEADAEPVVAGEEKQEELKPISIDKKKKGSKGWLVAACLVIVIGIGAYAFYTLHGEKEDVTAAAPQPQKPTGEAPAIATSNSVAQPNETQSTEEQTAASADETVATATNGGTTESNQTVQKTEPASAKDTQQAIKKTESTPANAAVTTTPAVAQTPKASKGKYSIVGLKCEHKVVSGETLRKIALKYYGTKELSPYIVEYNNIKQPDKVAVGVVLKIPELKENE